MDWSSAAFYQFKYKTDVDFEVPNWNLAQAGHGDKQRSDGLPLPGTRRWDDPGCQVKPPAN